MQRNIEKAIKDYRKKFYNQKRSACCYYPSDIQEIVDFTETECESKESVPTTWDYIINGIECGTIIGYRQGVRDTKRKKSKNPQQEELIKMIESINNPNLVDWLHKFVTDAIRKWN